MKNLIWATVISIAGISITIIISSYTGIPVSAFTADIFLVADHIPYYGLLSNLGAFVWFSAFTINAFTSIILTKLQEYKYIDFLNSSAIFSFILFFDDFFMLHDYWLRIVFGRFDLIFYLVLGIIFTAYLFYFRKIILSSNYYLLLTSLIFLASSIVLDLFQQEIIRMIGHWQYLVEDGPKWIGICFWTAYYFDFCSKRLLNVASESARQREFANESNN